MLLAGGGQAEDPQWRRYATGHFELWTQADPGVARQTVFHLEAIWSRLLSGQFPGLRAPAGRVKVLTFSSELDYARYRVDPGSPAYFVGGPGGGYVVVGRPTKDLPALLTHELTHAFLHSGGARWPWWVEEGLAENLARPVRVPPDGGDAAFLNLHCASPPGPATRAECYSRARNHVAWILSGTQRQTRFWQWMAGASGNGQPPDAARDGQIAEHDAADSIAAVRAELLARLGRIDEAIGELDALGVGPPSAGIQRSIGLHAIARGRVEQGLQLLRQAYRLGDRDPAMLRELAFAEQSAPAGHFLEYMEALLAASPADDASRMVLASHYLFQGRHDDARRHLGLVREIPSGQRAYYRRAALVAGLSVPAQASPGDE